MRTRTIRAWAVLVPLAAVFAAVCDPAAWLEAAAGGLSLGGAAVLVALDGLRERGMPRRRP